LILERKTHFFVSVIRRYRLSNTKSTILEEGKVIVGTGNKYPMEKHASPTEKIETPGFDDTPFSRPPVATFDQMVSSFSRGFVVINIG
jgi:hypothetical protein